MPRRRVLFSNNEYYHVFNKTIDLKKPFLNDKLCDAFLDTAYFYRATDFQLCFSQWKALKTIRKDISEHLSNPHNFRVNILAYCLMPNHFHFLLQQRLEGGVQEFMSSLSNSFTRAFNTQYNRKGQLFLNRFQAVPISSVEQLLVASRYIHLNPIASAIVAKPHQLHTYPWSSYKHYFSRNRQTTALVSTQPILTYFGNNPEHYRDFVESELDRAQTLDYVNSIFNL